MKLTKSQGLACLKALEKIERGEWDGETLLHFPRSVVDSIETIGWAEYGIQGPQKFFHYGQDGYEQKQVATALSMCVTLSGIELRYAYRAEFKEVN